jgi:hypothetical protein
VAAQGFAAARLLRQTSRTRWEQVGKQNVQEWIVSLLASTSLVTIQPVFNDSERLPLAGFLAGYRGLTREAYTLDLRQFTAWCRARSLSLFSVPPR